MIIDSHCHLHDAAFAGVRQTVEHAFTQGVWGIVGVGCDASTNERTLAAARTLPRAAWAALGFHPDRASLTDEDLERVEEQVTAHHAEIVAVGEVGLPWYSLEGISDAPAIMARGRARLDRLIALASRFDLAIVLHAPHDAAASALEVLKRHEVERAVFHWHKAPVEVTRAIVDAGYLVSVTPEVVYRERDRELVAEVPLGSLLVESDAPWAYHGEFEGLPSGPWLASRVAEEVAKIKHVPVDDMMFELTTNASRLFHLAWQ
jgi:TatD DNase family protein